ncbi:MAG: MAPEG family protein [Pseudomonadota bacterium]
MTNELTVLALAGILQVIQLVLMAVPANIQLGTDKTLGPRDQPLELHGIAGRLKRALDNHFEGLILFTIAVVVVTLGEKANNYTATCAWVYLVARILYIPAYASGIPVLRTVMWLGGFVATLAMLVSSLA